LAVNRLATAWMRRRTEGGKGHDHPTIAITRELYRLGDGCERQFATQEYRKRRLRARSYRGRFCLDASGDAKAIMSVLDLRTSI
jgi:hypothetical protein